MPGGGASAQWDAAFRDSAGTQGPLGPLSRSRAGGGFASSACAPQAWSSCSARGPRSHDAHSLCSAGKQGSASRRVLVWALAPRLQPPRQSWVSAHTPGRTPRGGSSMCLCLSAHPRPPPPASHGP